MANNVTVSASAQSGATLADKLTSAYALAPTVPDRLIVLIEAGIPKHTGEVLPTPPANCDLLDYRTIWEAPASISDGNAILDFGFADGGEGDTATVTVSAPWVDTTSVIVCEAACLVSVDHEVKDAVVEDIRARATNVVPGVSFDIVGYAPNGTWGRHKVVYNGLLRSTQ